MSARRELPPGFEYVQILGSGAFGEVVLARHIALDRLVAIKRIHRTGLVDDDAVSRFRREAQVLAGLRHPHIVQVYDFKIVADDAVMVMEFVRGRALSELLDDAAVSASEGLQILRDVADALAAAAALHVVHRDVKPGNVFVLADGHAKLGDFGLARVLADESIFRTVQGRAGGTPAYFPPEISQGLAEPDERADAYSFAVMAYEVLTGQLPFTAENPMAVIAAHWHNTAADPGDVVAGFPRAAADALLVGLEKDPARRLLPGDLMTRLEDVPVEEWRAVVRQRRPDASATERARATRQISASAAPQPVRAEGTRAHVDAPAPASRGGRRRIRRWLVPSLAGAAALVVALIIAIVLVTRKHPTAPPLRVTALAVDVAGQVSGRCPVADFRFVATIATNGVAGTVVVQWTRPDGGRTTVQRLPASAGARVVRTGLNFHVSGSRALAGGANLHVISPNVMDAVSHHIAYRCRN